MPNTVMNRSGMRSKDAHQYPNNYTLNAVDAHQNSADYERIRVVGRGSFGMAVLYRRRDDESLVILKEVNLHDLSSVERQLALNEVVLLSRLHHPHIVSYYDSFEKDGVLMIEMEYADGGTLAQFLSRQNDLIPESKVVFMFEQMACAVAYLHDNHVLHRDLKTANVFLTTENVVKVGDFGISKHMGTSTNFQGAQTILGTPYYLSPEMCKGNSYNEKSDIWALGCCLYEMVCLRKTFDGSTLPILVNKIVHAEYEQIKGPFSSELKLLLREMLRTEPDQRPTAARVLEIIHRHQVQFSRRNRNAKGVAAATKTSVEERRPQSFGNGSSSIYQFNVADFTLSSITTAPTKIKVKQLAVGVNHQLLLTSDSQAYSWGSNENGQLGHGDRKNRDIPALIDAFNDRNVLKIAAGNAFSVFCVDQGIAMSCGNWQFMGDECKKKDWLRPRIINSLLRENIVDLACGEEHVVVLCENGDVLAWGKGESGELGNGECSSVFTPIRVEIPNQQMISHVKCGPDCTLFITSFGTVLATGSNRYNKLNLNKRIGFFANEECEFQREVKNVLVPTALPMKVFRSRVIDANLGPNHSGVLLENGRIHLFGSNRNGELGIGNRASAPSWKSVKEIQTKTCVHLICGDGFTMIATADNELYFWGSQKAENAAHDNRTTVYKNDDQLMPATTSADANDNNTEQQSRLANPDSPITKNMKKTRNFNENDVSAIFLPKPYTSVIPPTLVLRLDVKRSNSASASNIQPLSIQMASLTCNRKRVFVIIDTTPVAASFVSRAKLMSRRNSLADNPEMKMRRRSAPENTSSLGSNGVFAWPNALNGADGNVDANAYSRIIEREIDKIVCESVEEEHIIQEIHSISKTLQNASNQTSADYEKQVNELGEKMAKLEVLQRNKLTSKPKIIGNFLAPHVQTKICSIL